MFNICASYFFSYRRSYVSAAFRSPVRYNSTSFTLPFPFLSFFVSLSLTWCIIFLLLHNKITQTRLKMIHICYLTVSMNQEFRHSLAGSSAQVFTRLQPRCWLGCILIWRFQLGKNLLPGSFKLAGFMSLRMYYWGPRLLIGCWLETSHSFLPNGLLNMAACFIRTARRISHSSLLRWNLMWCNVNMSMISHHLFRVLFVRSKS